MFQHDLLFPWRTTLRNVTFGTELRGIPRKKAEQEARDIISLVGLAGFENHYPFEFSGGMRQRVNLARAFAVNPDILLMDEPFAALDALTREAMQQELVRIVAETRKTVVFINDQIDEAVLLADRIAVFSARPGRVARIMNVDLPKPRTLALKRTPEFQAMVDQVWSLVAGPPRGNRTRKVGARGQGVRALDQAAIRSTVDLQVLARHEPGLGAAQVGARAANSSGVPRRFAAMEAAMSWSACSTEMPRLAACSPAMKR